MKISHRKVVEVLPGLHNAIKREAERRHLRVSLLATVLLAYGLEHIDKAITETDSLLEKHEDT